MSENSGEVEYHATVLNGGALDEQRSFAILDHIKSDVGIGAVLPESRLTLIHGGAPADFSEGDEFVVSIRRKNAKVKDRAADQAQATVDAVNLPPVPAAETNAIEERRAADQDAAIEAAFVEGTLPEVDRRHEDQGEGPE